MARRRGGNRRSVSVSALERAASQAAEVGRRDVRRPSPLEVMEVRPRPEFPVKVLRPRAVVVKQRLRREVAPLVHRTHSVSRDPRQLVLLDTKKQRDATVRALQLAAGRPIGRRTRERLKRELPKVLSDTICKPTRVRRSVMFAQGAAGKGKRAAARRARTQRRLC